MVGIYGIDTENEHLAARNDIKRLVERGPRRRGNVEGHRAASGGARNGATIVHRSSERQRTLESVIEAPVVIDVDRSVSECGVGIDGHSAGSRDAITAAIRTLPQGSKASANTRAFGQTEHR